MAYYTHNTNPNYYKENYAFSNCGSYAFNIEEWYDADNGFEWEVGNIDSWVTEMATYYSDEEISEMYSKAVVEQIFDDFDEEIRELSSESDPLLPNEELVAFRGYCEYFEDSGDSDYDFHFKVFRDGQWMEKCGSCPVQPCTLEDWSYDYRTYNSKTYFFAHAV